MNLKPISFNHAITIISNHIMLPKDFDKYYFFLKNNNRYHKVQKIDLIKDCIICEDLYIESIKNILELEGIDEKLFIKNYLEPTQIYIKESFFNEMLEEGTSLNLKKNKFLLYDGINDKEYIGISEKGQQYYLKSDIVEYIEY